MNKPATLPRFEASVVCATFVALLIALAALTGCESTEGGSNVSANVYYGTGFYDPWYYGGYYGDIDVIVTPPDRPDRPDSGPRPEHPIARPPSSVPRPTPMPSIPSAPRASFRR
jgi:hypothetical protein